MDLTPAIAGVIGVIALTCYSLGAVMGYCTRILGEDRRREAQMKEETDGDIQ